MVGVFETEIARIAGVFWGVIFNMDFGFYLYFGLLFTLTGWHLEYGVDDVLKDG